MTDTRQPVPVRTMLVAIGLVVTTYLTLRAIVLLAHIETLLVVAAFFAVVLTPAVDFVRGKLHISRGLSTAIVFIVGIAILAGLLYAFIRPLVDEGRKFADNFPTYVSDAREGRGPAGDLVKRYNLDERLRDAQADIEDSLASAGGGALKVAGRVLGGVVSGLTILVLSLMMVLYGPDILKNAPRHPRPDQRQERVKAVASDCARALTGYVMGNLLISVVAGTLTFIALSSSACPSRRPGPVDRLRRPHPAGRRHPGRHPHHRRGLPALHRRRHRDADLLRDLPAVREPRPAGARSCPRRSHINQLFVLVSVLIGVELLGFLGALLAIPAAGVIQVIVRDLWDHRAGRWKEEPTIGTEEIPVSEVGRRRRGPDAPDRRVSE